MYNLHVIKHPYQEAKCESCLRYVCALLGNFILLRRVTVALVYNSKCRAMLLKFYLNKLKSIVSLKDHRCD